MKIEVIRDTFTNKSTIGKLTLGGRFFCYTLEDVDRDANKDGDLLDLNEAKVHSKTCIPRGTYSIQLTMSNRFKKVLPLLVKVPGFEGIRIHPGNSDVDTEGCILVGESKALNFIGGSKITFDKLMDIMTKAKTPITITIK